MRTNTEHVPIRYVGPDAGVEAQTDPEQIGQVFTNIIKNAIQAIGEKTEADIIVILNAAYSDREIEVSISDNGPGIPKADQPKIFVPNFTTKTTAQDSDSPSRRILSRALGDASDLIQIVEVQHSMFTSQKHKLTNRFYKQKTA